MKVFNRKSLALVISLLIATITLGVLNYSQTSANPDYICSKYITGTCKISSCGSWSGGKRLCTGKRASMVSYAHRRTSCEPGYFRSRTFANTGGASGRHSGNWVSAYSACSIYQYDSQAPSGNLNYTNE